MQEIEFNRISGLHPKAAALVTQLHAVSYTATVKDIEPAGLLALARLYPIHVVEKESPVVTDAEDSAVQEESTFQVIAGFRLYELMCVNLQAKLIHHLHRILIRFTQSVLQ